MSRTMSRPQTPVHEAYGSSPAPNASVPHISSPRPLSYVGSTKQPPSHLDNGMDDQPDYVHDDHIHSDPLEHSQPMPAASLHGSQMDMNHHDVDEVEVNHVDINGAPDLHRTASQTSQAQSHVPSRGNTLKKKASLKKSNSLKRTSSRRSSRAGSVKSMALGEKEKYVEGEEHNSAFHTPIPTSGSPTDVLASRFQAWRKILKDLIAYFRDVQKSLDVKAKTAMSAANVIHNSSIQPQFLGSGGINDAILILREFQKQSIMDANKARDMENEVIQQLTGLRSDLQQKIKEIKSLSGDFKNSVEKEANGTKRLARDYQEALGLVDSQPGAASGKGDPFIVKMGVDRQLERQIEEENYLHRAYLNLESSGRELESIVVGEIQKAYNAYASILKREADEAHEASDKLRNGPLAIGKDHEWNHFVETDAHMVDPKIPVRTLKHISYPGKDHPAAMEVKSGMLERKSKYLKNYSPGWYILSPTHLHEFKSADRIATQAPIMSLYLPEQKLGTHSEPSSSSHKFMLKGRQTGSMHRGHAWVFRAESHDTMMAWFNDLKELSEKKGEDRNAFVRRTHARSMSDHSLKAASVGGSSDGGMEEDEADKVPYSSEQSVRGSTAGLGATVGPGEDLGPTALDYNADDRSEAGWRPPSQRPSPGGRFPSEVNVDRGLQAPLSPSSEESSHADRDLMASATGMPGSGVPYTSVNEPVATATEAEPVESHPNLLPQAPSENPQPLDEGQWMSPVIAGAGGAVVGAAAIHHHEQEEPAEPVKTATQEMDEASAVPVMGTSSPPIPVATSAPTASYSTDTNSLSTVPTSVDSPTQYAAVGNIDKSAAQIPKPAEFTNSTTATASTPAPYIPYFERVAADRSAARVPSGVTTGTYGYTSYYDKSAMETTAPPVKAPIVPTPMDTLAVPSRPVAHSSKSVTTISDLHIPGEFPRLAEL